MTGLEGKVEGLAEGLNTKPGNVRRESEGTEGTEEGKVRLRGWRVRQRI